MKLNVFRKIDLPATLALLGITITWSTGPLFVHQFYLEKLSVWDQNLFRYVLVMFLIWPTVGLKALSRRDRSLPALNGRMWGRALIAALPAMGAQVFFAWSLYQLQPGLVGMLHKLCVICSAVLAMYFFRDERRLLGSGLFWGGAMGGILGAVGVFALNGEMTWQVQGLGFLFIVIFSVCWGFYGVGIRIFMRHIDPVRGCAMVMTYIMGCLLVLSLVWGEPLTFMHLSGRVWLLMILSAVLHLYLPHITLYWIISRLGVTIPNTVLLLTAFLTGLFSWWIFSERLSAWQWGSGMILIVGAALTLLAQQNLKE